jgi:hypothetical protein
VGEAKLLGQQTSKKGVKKYMKILEFGACEYASGEKQWPIARDYCGHTCSSDFGRLWVFTSLFFIFTTHFPLKKELRLKTGTDLQTGAI